ncbi:Acetyltransferase (GNAT) family protein [Rosistilla oblonga]|uniref:GNAT family N-acetyltransferase n=1 Tax=Rosistilla oblonga TaxID=2527990 RepID=UPI001189FC9E|nr:GNAT family N-acetyltransferase [Rosistilla oblonga]QDV13818.1 Acetyltransferase (GNAT) family protein [Rosistilla oblonga]
MLEPQLSAPVPLAKKHQLDSFSCGDAAFDEYLVRFAFTNHRSGAARTYVACRGRKVVGFHSLAFGSVDIQTATPRVAKGLPQHPIPIMLLARLAVDQSEQGTGIGKGLLKDAIMRTLQAAEIGGLRAILVHAKEKQAQAFYKKFGFEPCPTNELHLMMLLKDMRKSVGAIWFPIVTAQGTSNACR